MLITHARVLVTGGAGFIGSNLCSRLLQQENEVVCLDNFMTGHRSNIEPFLANRNFVLMEGDIRNYEVCTRAVDGVDYVLHQAALGSVPRSVKDPMTSTDVNVGGFVKMLFAAKEAKVKRFVYAASSSTYGDHQDLPKVEEKIGNQLSPYAITKYADELFARNFTEIYGIETVGLRYFNVFGPGQDPEGAYAAVIPKWIRLMLDGVRPLINGDGSISRDFTFIENVLHVNQLAAKYPPQPASEKYPPQPASEKYPPQPLPEDREGLASAGVYNVACGERTSLNQLFYIIRDCLAEFKPEIAGMEPVYGPGRGGDIPHSLADISKARRELGYDPAINVREGLRRTCEWFITHRRDA